MFSRGDSTKVDEDTTKMSLYDDLDGVPMQTPSSNESGELSGWSSSLKLMQTQLQRKRVVQNKPAFSGQKSTVINSVILDRGLKRANDDQEDSRQTVNNEPTPRSQLQSGEKSSEPFIETEASVAVVVDEYDPLRPNEYEVVKEKHREVRDREKREARERERSSRDGERERDRDNYRERDYDRDRDKDYDSRDRDRDRDRDRERRRDRHRNNDSDEETSYSRRSSKRPSGAAIAPPTFLTEESTPDPVEDDEPLEPLFERKPFASISDPEKPNVGFNSPIASQIMAKYGWKDGQGLGKQEQGINTCLQVEKTSKRGGKIINKDKEAKAQSIEQDSLVSTMKNPSKVVLLRNMVGPGEVDDDLQPETAEECAKYGEVAKVIIYEIPEGVAEDEAVRIFVEFQRVESAIKAVVDLNGRYFGGRTVKATFYNLDRFRRYDLHMD